MTVKQIIEKLQDNWPEKYALDWDNVGLLVGDEEQEVHHIFVALDVTDSTLEQAVAAGADMFISHHPLLFSPPKRIVESDFIGRKVRKLITNGISYYAMHTNFDVTGMANLNASSLSLMFPTPLEVTYEDDTGKKEGVGRVGMLDKTLTLEEFGVYVKENLNLPMVRVYGENDKQIEKVAICGGGGKGMEEFAIKAGADVLVTGDVSYHMGLDSVQRGLAIVDAGHYGTEMIFIDYMEETLREMFSDLTITSAKVEQPFSLV